jgi:glycosyltransferase involved in cell wall biosynthesis
MLISVIIPTCLRSENELIRSIDSALWNGYNDIEILVVNDNRVKSFDEFILLTERYKSSPVRFLYNTGKKGAASARNYGVNYAHGVLVTFLDDDDFLLPSRLECMVNWFNQPDDNIVLVSTGRVYEYNNLERIEVVKKQIFGRLKLKDISIHNQIDIGFMIRKSTFIELNGFDTTFNNLEDWDFIIRCLLLGDAYKIKSYSYIVKNDVNPNRVSHNDYLGLKQLANKHKDDFGDKWFYKIKTQELRSSGTLSLIESFNLTYKLKSIYPMKNYIATLVRK